MKHFLPVLLVFVLRRFTHCLPLGWRTADHTVIASGAKQSSAVAPRLDCFVASFLAMTIFLVFSHIARRSVGALLTTQSASDEGRVACDEGRVAIDEGRVACDEGRVAIDEGRVASTLGRVAPALAQSALALRQSAYARKGIILHQPGKGASLLMNRTAQGACPVRDKVRVLVGTRCMS
jgi:hypothetical protein